MQQSRARMLTAYTCSDTFSNRFNSTSDGSHSSLHATFRLTFRTYTLSRITVQAYACTSGHPPARSSPPLLGGRTIGRADRPCQHHDVCNHRCHRIPTVRKLPARSRHRSPTLSQTVRGKSSRNPNRAGIESIASVWSISGDSFPLRAAWRRLI